jgi:hypothetical protein
MRSSSSTYSKCCRNLQADHHAHPSLSYFTASSFRNSCFLFQKCLLASHVILWHAAWKLKQFTARQQLSKHIPTEENACNNRRVVFSVVHTAYVAMQWCSKHISAAVNKHKTIQEAVFSVGATPRLYNEYLTQLELELSRVPGLAVALNNWGSLRSWQLAE